MATRTAKGYIQGTSAAFIPDPSPPLQGEVAIYLCSLSTLKLFSRMGDEPHGRLKRQLEDVAELQDKQSEKLAKIRAEDTVRQGSCSHRRHTSS